MPSHKYRTSSCENLLRDKLKTSQRFAHTRSFPNLTFQDDFCSKTPSNSNLGCHSPSTPSSLDDLSTNNSFDDDCFAKNTAPLPSCQVRKGLLPCSNPQAHLPHFTKNTTKVQFLALNQKSQHHPPTTQSDREDSEDDKSFISSQEGIIDCITAPSSSIDSIPPRKPSIFKRFKKRCLQGKGKSKSKKCVRGRGKSKSYSNLTDLSFHSSQEGSCYNSVGASSSLADGLNTTSLFSNLTPIQANTEDILKVVKTKDILKVVKTLVEKVVNLEKTDVLCQQITITKKNNANAFEPQKDPKQDKLKSSIRVTNQNNANSCTPRELREQEKLLQSFTRLYEFLKNNTLDNKPHLYIEQFNKYFRCWNLYKSQDKHNQIEVEITYLHQPKSQGTKELKQQVYPVFSNNSYQPKHISDPYIRPFENKKIYPFLQEALLKTASISYENQDTSQSYTVVAMNCRQKMPQKTEENSQCLKIPALIEDAVSNAKGGMCFTKGKKDPVYIIFKNAKTSKQQPTKQSASSIYSVNHQEVANSAIPLNHAPSIQQPNFTPQKRTYFKHKVYAISAIVGLFFTLYFLWKNMKERMSPSINLLWLLIGAIITIVFFVLYHGSKPTDRSHAAEPSPSNEFEITSVENPLAQTATLFD